MNTKSGILSVIPALAVIAALLLLWTQETVLAAEQTYTIDDETSYEVLREALDRDDNKKADAVTFSNDTHTITIDFEKVCVFTLSSVNRINLSEQAKNFVNELFAKSGNLKNVRLNNVNLEGIQLTNLSGKTSMERLSMTNCGLSDFPNIKLDNLVYLNVSANPFGNSDTVKSYLTDSNFGGVTRLTMYDCSLTSVPDIKLSNLKVLNMSENDFSAAGACNNLNRTNFPALEQLHLDKCQISDIGFLSNIGSNLTELGLGINKLTNDSLDVLIGMKNNLINLKYLGVGCRVLTDYTTAEDGYDSNKITDTGKLASLFKEFSSLTTLDVSGLGITSLQDFSLVNGLGRPVSLNADYNKIIDFAGLENSSSNDIDLSDQSITLPGKFNPGEEYEIPKLIQRILDQNDALSGTLIYKNCSLSNDGKKLVIKPDAVGAYVTVKSGKLWDSKIEFSLREIPPYTIPQGLTATVGDTLAKVTLPSGFTWKDAAMDVGEEGTNTFEAVYTPQDTDRYMTVSVNIPVKVTEPNKPTEPVTEPTEPTKPVVPTEPVTDPAKPTNPAEPTAAPSQENDEEDEEEQGAAAAAEASPRTSDTSPVVPVTVLLLVSGMVLGIMVSDKKNRFHLKK